MQISTPEPRRVELRLGLQMPRIPSMTFSITPTSQTIRRVRFRRICSSATWALEGSKRTLISTVLVWPILTHEMVADSDM